MEYNNGYVNTRRRFLAWLMLLAMLCAQPGLTVASSWAENSPVVIQDDLEARVEAIFDQLSVKERVGQLFMVSFVGLSAEPEDDISELIHDYKVGSVIYLELNGNVDNKAPDTPAQVAALSNQLQRHAYEATYHESPDGDFFLPLFIAVDHEGDESPLTRLRHGFTSIPSTMALGATWSPDDVEAVGAIVGQEMAAVGVNMLLGPVVDVLEKPHPEGSGDINVRAFGGSAFWVGLLGRAYIRGVHQGGRGRVLTVAKHFPGHGASDRLPDDEVATVNKSLDELRQSDLLPFFDVTRADPDDPLGLTDAMMPSHIRYRGFQGDVSQLTRPISLDRDGMAAFMALPPLAAWRQEGLIVCDALGVPAIKDYYDPTGQTFPARQIAKDALMAGNDVLPLVNFAPLDEPSWDKGQLPTIQETITFFQEEYQVNRDFRQRVDDAVRHVLRAKLRLYPDLVLESVLVTGEEPVGLGNTIVTDVARKGLTLLSPQLEDLPHRLPAPPRSDEDILIMGCFEDCLARRLQGDTIRDALLNLYGPGGSDVIDPERVHLLDFMQLYLLLTDQLDETEDEDGKSEAQVVVEQVQNADWIVLILVNYAPDVLPQTGAARLFLRDSRFDLRDKKVVALSLHAPYYLDATEIGKLDAYYAVYSKADPSLRVALRALFQDITPIGVPPVSIVGISYDLAAALRPDPDQALALTLDDGADAVWRVGDTVRVRTSPLLDHNGHPVPDGTRVLFRGDYADLSINLVPSWISDTVNGVAWAVFQPTLAGRLEISASSDDVRSESVALLVAPEAVSGEIPTATAAPPTLRAEPTRPSGSTELKVSSQAQDETATALSPLPVGTPTVQPTTAPPEGGSQLPVVPLLVVVILAVLLVIGLLVFLRRQSRPASPRLAALPPPAALDDEGTFSVDLPLSALTLTGRTLSSCRVGRKLGQGGMGQVYQGYHPMLDRSVAIKVLPPALIQSEEMRARFLQEARIAAALRHPNIVQIYDFGQDADLIYMIMEYVDGVSLKERLTQLRASGQTMPVAQAVEITRQIASALAYAHEQGAIHRDLKPANILLNARGQAILVDFGLAVLGDSPRYTEPGKVWGSPVYIAPEQLDEPPSVDARSDIYSLGVVLYEMVANTPPFKTGSAMKILWQKVNLLPAPPSELVPSVSPALEAIILRALARRPDERYATAQEMAQALGQVGG
jgi:beta-N-acetylhexosaminidase